jgi:hypothetical protein
MPLGAAVCGFVLGAIVAKLLCHLHRGCCGVGHGHGGCGGHGHESCCGHGHHEDRHHGHGNGCCCGDGLGEYWEMEDGCGCGPGCGCGADDAELEETEIPTVE